MVIVVVVVNGSYSAAPYSSPDQECITIYKSQNQTSSKHIEKSEVMLVVITMRYMHVKTVMRQNLCQTELNIDSLCCCRHACLVGMWPVDVTSLSTLCNITPTPNTLCLLKSMIHTSIGIITITCVSYVQRTISPAQ